MLNWFKLTVFVKMHKRVSRIGEGYSAYTAALFQKRDRNSTAATMLTVTAMASTVIWRFLTLAPSPKPTNPPAGLDGS